VYWYGVDVVPLEYLTVPQGEYSMVETSVPTLFTLTLVEPR
jgi:hypothetical protein